MSTIEQLRDKCLQWLAAVAGDGAKLDVAEARIRELFATHISQAAERGLCERNPAPDAAAAVAITTTHHINYETAAERGEAVAFVPVHPRNGPLWMDTFAAGKTADRSSNYPLMALYTAPPPAAGVPDEISEGAVVFGDEDDDGYRMGWNDCRAAMLSATPSPEAKPHG